MRRSGPFGIRLSRLVSAAIACAGALVLASCGTPQYPYLQDGDLGTYLKVPYGWTVLGEDQILASDPTLSPSQRAAMKANGWFIGATSHLLRNADGSFSPDPSRPWVEAKVQGLSQQGHDVMSNQVMENFITDL